MNMENTTDAVSPLDIPVMPQRKTLNQWSRDELMRLPVREWSADSEYDSLLTISTRRKHDSGWAMMAIIGVVDGQPLEIACICCDDIEWKMPPMVCVGAYSIGQMRMDCAMRSGALHMWAWKGRFHVGAALSSTTVELRHNAMCTAKPAA
jgi:hypothetical protein